MFPSDLKCGAIISRSLWCNLGWKDSGRLNLAQRGQQHRRSDSQQKGCTRRRESHRERHPPSPCHGTCKGRFKKHFSKNADHNAGIDDRCDHSDQQNKTEAVIGNENTGCRFKVDVLSRQHHQPASPESGGPGTADGACERNEKRDGDPRRDLTKPLQILKEFDSAIRSSKMAENSKQSSRRQ